MTITRDAEAFLAIASAAQPDWGAPTAKAAFLVSPDGFARADESARDNVYMAGGEHFDPLRALLQHRDLHVALSATLPTVCFAGHADTPDAVFPNNAFATAPGRAIVGRMRHPVRQRETRRTDIRGFLRDTLGYAEVDLSAQPHACELTGALVIDRARGLGFAGLSERCDAEGARLMHEAFGLRATLLFDLAPGEYHTNVVLAVLAGRAAVVCPAGFVDATLPDVLNALYGPHVLRCTADEHAAFVGNCIALARDQVWMSSAADAALTPAGRNVLASAGFGVRSVPLDAIEAAGGSLRCCVGEIF